MGKQWNLFYSVVTVVGLNIRHVSGKLKFFKAKLIIPNPFYRCKKVLILLRQFKLTNKKRIKTAGFLFAFLVIFLCTRISLIIWNIFTTCFSFTFYIFIQFFYWKKMKLLLLFFICSYFFFVLLSSLKINFFVCFRKKDDKIFLNVEFVLSFKLNFLYCKFLI